MLTEDILHPPPTPGAAVELLNFDIDTVLVVTQYLEKVPMSMPQLSPGIILMSGIAHGGGILQSYLPAGVRIWFRANCGVRVFGDMANFPSEIG